MILRVFVCIPTYNNPKTISEITEQVLSETDLPVLVVDDGSNTPVRELFQSDVLNFALETKRLEIIRFEFNQGKGVALTKAISHCVEKGFTHLFSIDGDGQHLVKEMKHLLDQAKIYPWDLIIGARKMQHKDVPGVSKFGRAFSNFWVRFQTDNTVKDSQSGFRIYPLFYLQNMTFFSKSFDFEIEILVRLIWKSVSVRDVEIEVYYPPAAERVSHFDKLWDNVRISLLNTLFVIVTLLKSRRAPHESATALGLGVFIGCTPFYGLHSLIVAAVSVVLRLNAGVLFLGSQISIPPLAPFLVFFSIKLGNYLRRIDGLDSFAQRESLSAWIEFGRNNFISWLLGSLTMGAILGTIAGGSFYLFSLKFKKRSLKRPSWNGKTRGGKFGNLFLKVVLEKVGIKAGYSCLLFIVPYFYFFAPTGRKALKEYWTILRPQDSWLTQQINILKHFYKFGQILMDRVFQNIQSKKTFVSIPNGVEHIRNLDDSPTGLILLGAHMGGWDLASSLLGKYGFSKKVHVVEFQSQEQSFQKIKGETSGVGSVNTGQTPFAIFQIHEILKHRKTLGIMGDRPLGNRIMLVSLLGRLAPIDITPFRVAAATGAPLLFTFGFKDSGVHYNFYASQAKVYDYKNGYDREYQFLLWAQEYADHLGKMIVKYPYQWFNFYSFWSTRPASPIAETASTKSNYLLEEVNKPLKPRPASELSL